MMEQKPGRLPVMITVAAAAAAAFGLRLHQLSAGYETAADGMIRVLPGTSGGFFTWFTVIMAAAFAVFAWTRKGRKKFSSLGQLDPVSLGIACIASLLLLLGSTAMAVSPETAVERYLGLGGVAAALCWAATAVLRWQHKKPSVYLYLLPVVFFAVMLVVDFRIWSRDPAVLDYCYDLFALISVMLGLFYLSGYSLDLGFRRFTVFFLLCGVFFSAAAMAGARLRYVLILGGAMVWQLLHLWQLLRPLRQKQEG